MNGKKRTGISRRQFARQAAVVAAASLVPASMPTDNLESDSTVAAPPAQQSSNTPPLSPTSQAEAEARYQNILSLYGDRSSEAQKTDLRRLCLVAQPPLDRLRSFPLDNNDAPSLYLKPLIEREVKHTMPWNAAKAGPPKPSPVTKKP